MVEQMTVNHGTLDDIRREELDAINALLCRVEQEKIQKTKFDNHIEELEMAQKFYAPSTPLILDDKWIRKIAVDDKMNSKIYKNDINVIIQGKTASAKNQLEKIALQEIKNIILEKHESWLAPNRYAEEQKQQQPMLKKAADLPEPKTKAKSEPKHEYGELPKMTKKSFLDRLIDRIIKNIVWGK